MVTFDWRPAKFYFRIWKKSCWGAHVTDDRCKMSYSRAALLGKFTIFKLSTLHQSKLRCCANSKFLRCQLGTNHNCLVGHTQFFAPSAPLKSKLRCLANLKFLRCQLYANDNVSFLLQVRSSIKVLTSHRLLHGFSAERPSRILFELEPLIEIVISNE